MTQDDDYIANYIAKATWDIGVPIIDYRITEDNMNDSQDKLTAESEAPDMVNHPPHYTNGPDLGTLECIDITRWMPFTLGNAFKYVWRAGVKGGPDKAIEDLEKAKFYLDQWKFTAGEGIYPRAAQCVVGALFEKAFHRIEGNVFMANWREEALRAISLGVVITALTEVDKGIAAYKYMGDGTDGQD